MLDFLPLKTMNLLSAFREPNGLRSLTVMLDQLSYAPQRLQPVHRLIEAGAPVDAALALLALELPGWTVSHIGRDEDEWYCTLANRPWADPPCGLRVGDTVTAHHPELGQAIVEALLEARAAPIPPIDRRGTAATWPCQIACCENYR